MPLLITVAAQALAGIDIEQGHRTAPDAAGVECEHPRLWALTFKCRPVAKNDLGVSGFAFFVAEPWRKARRRGAQTLFALEDRKSTRLNSSH